MPSNDAPLRQVAGKDEQEIFSCTIPSCTGGLAHVQYVPTAWASFCARSSPDAQRGVHRNENIDANMYLLPLHTEHR
eukprot:9476474-Pyramimonas_sp.AAC.1